MQVLFVGGGSHARLCHHLLVAQGHSVPCVFDSKGIVPPWPCKVRKNESELSKLARMCDAFLVCIGDAYGSQRTKYSELLLDVGLFPADAISPACFIGDTVKTGRGLQAMP